MKDSKEVLSALLKTAQLGQVGIRSVMDTTMPPNLRQTLTAQLHEFDAIETEAHCMASRRGWELPELDPAVRFFTDRCIRFRLGGSSTDSLIAEFMIRGNTKGLIRNLRNIHQFTGQDDSLRILSQRLMDCETAHIRQLQNYL